MLETEYLWEDNKECKFFSLDFEVVLSRQLTADYLWMCQIFQTLQRNFLEGMNDWELFEAYINKQVYNIQKTLTFILWNDYVGDGLQPVLIYSKQTGTYFSSRDQSETCILIITKN